MSTLIIEKYLLFKCVLSRFNLFRAKYTRLLLKRLTGQSEKDERYSDKGIV